MATFHGNWFFRDVISAGGNANDVIYGHGGDDLLIGNNGRDTLYGGWGDDELMGGNDDDKLFGEDGNDLLSGGNDDDYLDGGNGDDVLNGGNHDDTLFGGNGNDELNGDAGQDYLAGGAGNDRMFGGQNNDRFQDYHGSNRFDGGTGTDTVDYAGYGGRIRVNLSDTGEGSAVRETRLFTVGSGERFNPDATDRLVSIENVTGSLYEDTITGNSFSNLLDGGGGRDVLNGGGGRDVILGGHGNDTIIGGEGADTMTGGEGYDSFVFNHGDSTVRVTSISGEVTVDTIVDFDIRFDSIDLRGVDSYTLTDVNESFRFADAFTGRPGQLLVRMDDSNSFRIIGDVNADGVGDMFIDVNTIGVTTIADLQALIFV